MFVCFWQSRPLLSRRLNSFSISCLILNLFDWRRLLTIYSLSTKNPIETNIWHQLHFVLKTFIVLKIISIYVYMYKYIIWHSYITWLFHSSEEVGYFALVFSTWQWNSLPPGFYGENTRFAAYLIFPYTTRSAVTTQARTKRIQP